MLLFPGYRVVEKIGDNDEITVYRVQREKDDKYMLAKTTNAHYVGPSVIELFQREFQQLLALKGEGVIEPISLEIIEERPILVFQNIEGITLQQLLLKKRQNLKFQDVLSVALAIVKCVNQIHNANIILNEIIPLYIIVDDNLLEAKLLDLRFSQLKGGENNYSVSARKVDSLLAYMSPEKTAHTKMTYDYRADFYSLGVVLYEWFASCLPFECENILDMRYHHIASKQKPAYVQNPSIPPIISSIIDKCMEKTPEARYASATSLKADLEECLAQFRVSGKIQPFTLASRDAVFGWFMQDRLFGRELEQQIILDMLQRVGQGETGAILVHGDAGTGKSYLINKILQQELSQDDFSISLRCELKNKNNPYSIWKQTIDKLVTQLLIENENQLEGWKSTILEALQGNEGILAELVPRLQLIIGEQSNDSVLSEAELESSMHCAIAEFMQLFFEKGRAFVLFIDDLHHADEQSIKYLQFLLNAHKTQNLLVICAYQTDELSLPPAYLQKAESQYLTRQIALKGFDTTEIGQLLHPLLSNVIQGEQTIIQLLLQKTAGNPQRLQQFMKEIAGQTLVAFDDISRSWKWDVRGIAALHVEKTNEAPPISLIKSLESPTSRLLSKAAFLGKQFKLHMLAEMAGSTIEQIQEALQIAINHQLIGILSNEKQIYTFLNEQIQQSFYMLVAEQDRGTMHMEAGVVLAKYLSTSEEISIINVLEHLNKAKEQMIACSKQVELAELNVQASLLVKKEKAYEQAAHYLQIAIDLLKKDNWHKDYAITYQVYKERAEIAFICEQNDYAKELLEIIIKNSQTDIDKVQAYILLIQLELSRDNYHEVLRLGEIALQLLNLPLNIKQGKFSLFFKWNRIQRKLRKFPSEEIKNLPQMQDERGKAAVQVLVYIANANLMSNKDSWLAAVLMLLELTLKYGMTVEASYGFASYALIKCLISSQYESAYHYSKFASEIAKNHPEMYMQANTIFALCQDSWRKYEPNFLLSLTDYANQHDALLNNKWQTNYNFLINCAQLFVYSYPLKDLYIRLLSRSSMFQLDYNTVHWKQAAILSQLLTRLTGYTAAHDPFTHDNFDIQSLLDAEVEEADQFLKGVAYWCDYITAYIFGHYEEAYEALTRSMEIDLSSGDNSIPNASDPFFYILIVKELFDDADNKTKASYSHQMRKCVKKLKQLAKRSPESYLHKYLFAEAESKKLKQQFKQAEHLYEQAIEAAQKYGHNHDVAIITESFAKYGMRSGKLTLAKVYINEAYKAYQSWGALAKTADLERQYGNLLLIKQATDLERVDYLTIVLSAQALSDEIEIERLLYKLLRIMLQNAGAEYGALIFDNEGKWFVEAYGTAEYLRIQSIPLYEANHIVPTAIIDYTARTKEEVVLHDATNSVFSKNKYIQHNQLKSVLCLPIMYQNKLLSVLYMENNLSKGVFTEERLDVLKLLCSQCAISITNAKLYSNIQYLTRNLEQQVEERTESLQKSMQVTSEALTEMTVYAERNRIAQEIHDIVGHTLTSTILQIEAGRRLLSKDMDGGIVRLKEAQDLVRHSLSEIRNSVHMLKEDKYYDLEQSLKVLIQDTEWNTGVEIHAHIDAVGHLPVIMKKLIYHALQEGLTNGIRHGQSSKFHFSLIDDSSSIQFELIDNGVGADHLQLGFGLKMMQERVQQLKGTFHVNSEQQKGCLIRFNLPYATQGTVGGMDK
ncbi:AAA family ATPase [Solibacillus sp. CAU 1738]|uniref:AAA family ATPase n=1 Tax=Solibacillus sp. CAU 1738 TaxID=3140363 RepID=UPI00326110A3